MLATKFRIGRRLRIEQLLKKGRRINGNFFQFRILPNRSATHRFACIVSKKVGKTAVTRNLIRRRLYEAIRRSGLTIPSVGGAVKTCYDVVVLCSGRAAAAEYAALAQDIENTLKFLP